MNLRKLPLGKLSKNDWLELGKMTLALVGFLAIMRWLTIPARPYCHDMNRIRVEVEAMNEAVRRFDDGQTELTDAVNQTVVQMRALQAVVENCQCPDEWNSP